MSDTVHHVVHINEGIKEQDVVRVVQYLIHTATQTKG